MRPRWLIAGAIALSPAPFAGCIQTVPAAPPQAAVPESRPAPAVDRPAGPRLEPARLEADELAEFLGVSVWTFHYSGGRARCWVEIEQDGKTTKHPPQGVQDPNKGNEKANEGKILLWLKPGTLRLRINSGISQGGHAEGLPDDALWWGWKGSTSQTMVSQPALTTPRPGEEVTLLRYDVTEHKEKTKDSKAPRKITMLLKAQFPEE